MNLIQQNIDLKKWNTWKVGGSADFFCSPKNLEDILAIFKWTKEKSISITYLGEGSNVLISDEGIEGLVINCCQLNQIRHWKQKERLHIVAQAGVSKAKLLQIFLHHQLEPSLFLCGLPGNVAGGVVMNAGMGDLVSPREFGEIVDWVTVVQQNGNVFVMNKEDIKWSYRESIGWQPSFIYEVGMSWPCKPVENLSKQFNAIALKRSRSQPLQLASCGSVFKNPSEKHKAGALIEQCGLKGHQIGEAQISKKHANFIVNLGGAKAMNIHELIQLAQKRVSNQFQISLTPEVKYMGRWEKTKAKATSY